MHLRSSRERKDRRIKGYDGQPRTDKCIRGQHDLMHVQYGERGGSLATWRREVLIVAATESSNTR